MTRPLAPPASSSFDSTVSAASLTSAASVTSSASGATAGSTASNPAAARGPGPLRIALACAAVLAVALGVGRFAFTPLLPLMLAQGALDIRHGGWLASVNYAGYFVGALSCAAIRIDETRMVRGGLLATIALTAAMGLLPGFAFWLPVRFLAGVVSAWTFVFAAQWGMRRLAEQDALQWGGVIFTGAGFGIVVTGLVGATLAGRRAEPGWLGFALLAVLLAAPIWRMFAPRAGERARAGTMWRPASSGRPGLHAAARRDARRLVLLYGAPGFGYIITATFLPVIARGALPIGSPWPDRFWPMFGAAQMLGAVFGSRLPARWDNRLLLALCYALQALAIVLGIVWPSAAGFALGSALLGLPFTAITLFAMREARRLHGDDAAGLMGYATACYGLGQIAGPLVAAPVVARAGSFSPALWIAVAVLLAGAAGFAAWGLAARGRAVERGGQGA